MHFSVHSQGVNPFICYRENSWTDFNLDRIMEALQRFFLTLGFNPPEMVPVRDLLEGYREARSDTGAVADSAVRSAAEDALVYGVADPVGHRLRQACAADARQFPSASRPPVSADGTWHRQFRDYQDIQAGRKVRFLPGYLLRSGRHYSSCTDPNLLAAVFHGLGFYFPLPTKLILVPMPRVQLDAQNRLHSVTMPAAEWRDGVKLHFLCGEHFTDGFWRKLTSGNSTLAEILAVPSFRHRMIAIRQYGYDKLLTETDAKLLSFIRGYKLYQVTDVFPVPAYFLRYKCPSTKRVYVSGVPPNIGRQKSAKTALAWKFQLLSRADRPLFTRES